MNALQEKFKDRGLSVVGVTNEGKALTEPWIKKHGAEYPYAYDPGGAFGRSLNLSAYPTVWLVDSAGNVVFAGNPGRIEDGMIEELLDGALTTPMWEWPASLSTIRKPFAKKQFAKAIEAAEKLGETNQDAARIREEILGIVSHRRTAFEKAYEEGNFLVAHTLATAAKKELQGLPAAEEAVTMLGKIKSDKAASTIMRAQKTIGRIARETVRSAKDAEKLIAQLEKIARKHPETVAETEANKGIERIRAQRR